MTVELNTSQKRLGTALFYGILIVLVYLVFLVFQPFLAALAWAVVLVVVAYPVYARLAKRWGRTLAATASTLGVTLIIIVPTLLVTGAFIRQGVEAVQLGQAAAHDYNPFGTGPENRDLVGNLVDGDPNTTWSTEQYYDGTLQKAGGVGLGIYLDAAPRVLAKALEIQTTTPGFAVQGYAGDHPKLEQPFGDSTSLVARSWQGPVGASTHVRSGQRIPLTLDGRPHRYYLVWLTTLPPKMESATIAELTLFK